jgi:hypothetical protein
MLHKLVPTGAPLLSLQAQNRGELMGDVVNLRAEPTERWSATLWYRASHGLVPCEVTFEELDELDAIVEHGPDWRTLDRIEVKLARNDAPGLTVEKSETL